MRRYLDRILATFLVGLMAAAVLNVWWQVFTRWVLDDPSSYTEELARYLLVWIGTLGAAYAVGKKLHLAIDLVPQALTGQKRHLMEVVIQSMIVLFALFVMVIGGARLVALTTQFGQFSAALGLPLGFVYSVIPLSGVIIIFYAGIEIGQRIRILRGGDASPRPPQRATTKPID